MSTRVKQRELGDAEFFRRKKQQQLDKKKNPKKSKKELKNEVKLQVQFLKDVRSAKAQGTIQTTLERYEKEIGPNVLSQLIKRCNVAHWL